MSRAKPLCAVCKAKGTRECLTCQQEHLCGTCYPSFKCLNPRDSNKRMIGLDDSLQLAQKKSKKIKNNESDLAPGNAATDTLEDGSESQAAQADNEADLASGNAATDTLEDGSESQGAQAADNEADLASGNAATDTLEDGSESQADNEADLASGNAATDTLEDGSESQAAQADNEVVPEKTDDHGASKSSQVEELLGQLFGSESSALPSRPLKQDGDDSDSESSHSRCYSDCGTGTTGNHDKFSRTSNSKSETDTRTFDDLELAVCGNLGEQWPNKNNSFFSGILNFRNNLFLSVGHSLIVEGEKFTYLGAACIDDDPFIKGPLYIAASELKMDNVNNCSQWSLKRILVSSEFPWPEDAGPQEQFENIFRNDLGYIDYSVFNSKYVLDCICQEIDVFTEGLLQKSIASAAKRAHVEDTPSFIGKASMRARMKAATEPHPKTLSTDNNMDEDAAGGSRRDGSLTGNLSASGRGVRSRGRGGRVQPSAPRNRSRNERVKHTAANPSTNHTAANPSTNNATASTNQQKDIDAIAAIVTSKQIQISDRDAATPAAASAKSGSTLTKPQFSTAATTPAHLLLNFEELHQLEVTMKKRFATDKMEEREREHKDLAQINRLEDERISDQLATQNRRDIAKINANIAEMRASMSFEDIKGELLKKQQANAQLIAQELRASEIAGARHTQMMVSRNYDSPFHVMGGTTDTVSAASSAQHAPVPATMTRTTPSATIADTEHIIAAATASAVTELVVVAQAQQISESAKFALTADRATVWKHFSNEKYWNAATDLEYYITEMGLSADTLDCLDIEEVNEISQLMKDFPARKFLGFFKV